VHVLVLGGTRFIGYAAVKEFLGRGMRVTIFNRGTRRVQFPPVVEELRGDRDKESDVRALAERRFDVIVDTSALRADQTERVVRNFAGRTKHLIHCSSGACYRPSQRFPWSEDGPEVFGPWKLWGDYGRHKLACEHVLLDAHRERGFPATLVRPPYVLGPRNYVDRERFIFNRLLSGAPILVPDGGQAVIHCVNVDDVARLFAEITLQRERTVGQIYNAAGRELVTLTGLVELCAEVAGSEPRILRADTERHGDVSSTFNPANCMFPFPNENYILDTSKIMRHLGISAEFVSLGDSLKQYYTWYKRTPAERNWERHPLEMAMLDRLGDLTERSSIP